MPYSGCLFRFRAVAVCAVCPIHTVRPETDSTELSRLVASVGGGRRCQYIIGQNVYREPITLLALLGGGARQRDVRWGPSPCDSNVELVVDCIR